MKQINLQTYDKNNYMIDIITNHKLTCLEIIKKSINDK
jgi:hypothetical protein